ncbi:hypothetical protein NCR96_09070 [Helicobacter sp. 14348-15]|uniref:hypothetical protein n=1 Tax=Helicobacter colisuis TaxID=2949739 RepID=UPI00202B74E8|nr:hypothetical protein [Helicobacter colisuis]MCL9821884.1 hypothetical protein [Helicobacter colisuis]
METATLHEFKKILNESYKKEIETRWNCAGREELEILKYLKYDLLHLKDELFNERDELTLYKLAEQVEDFTEGDEYNPFKDYPLCDALEGIYHDYSELCATYAEGLIDKSQIDLSDLESLKQSLAQNLIKTILENYQSDIEYFMYENHTPYYNRESLIMLLEQETNDLPFAISIDFDRNPNCQEIILLDSIALSEQSKKDLKEFLKDNKGWESNYSSIDDFLCLNELKEELEQESQIRTRKNRR